MVRQLMEPVPEEDEALVKHGQRPVFRWKGEMQGVLCVSNMFIDGRN